LGNDLIFDLQFLSKTNHCYNKQTTKQIFTADNWAHLPLNRYYDLIFDLHFFSKTNYCYNKQTKQILTADN